MIPSLFSERVNQPNQLTTSAAIDLWVSAGDPARDRAEHFVRDRSGRLGEIVCAQCGAALFADQRYDVTDRDVGDGSDVERGLVHADGTRDRNGDATDDRATAIRCAPVQPVGITDGDGRRPGRLAGDELAPIAHALANAPRHRVAHDPLPAERRAEPWQVDPAPDRTNAIDDESGPNQVQPCFGKAKQPW